MLLTTVGEMFKYIKSGSPLMLFGNVPGVSDSHVITTTKATRWVNIFLGITIAYSDYYFYCHYGYSKTYSNSSVEYVSENNVKVHFAFSLSNLIGIMVWFN